MPSKPVLSEADKETLRRKLEDLCEASWTARGYKRTGVKELCGQAGISIGTFYTLYPTKEELFLETIRMIQKRLAEKVLETNRRERSKSGFARSMKELFREYCGKPFLYEVHTPDFQSFVTKLPPEAVEELRLDSFRIFRQAVEAARLRLKVEESQAYGALSALLSTAGAGETLSLTCDPLAVFDFLTDILAEQIFV